MLELLAIKCRSGDAYVSLANRYLHNNEWGKASIAIERGPEKGDLDDPESVLKLLSDVNSRLGIGREDNTAL